MTDVNANRTVLKDFAIGFNSIGGCNYGVLVVASVDKLQIVIPLALLFLSNLPTFKAQCMFGFNYVADLLMFRFYLTYFCSLNVIINTDDLLQLVKVVFCFKFGLRLFSFYLLVVVETVSLLAKIRLFTTIFLLLFPSLIIECILSYTIR